MRWREPRSMRRAALVLWGAWAVIVWNVVFDHTIEVAGRRYLHAAGLAADAGGPYARIDDWMHPAVALGLWRACAAAGAIIAVGWLGIRAGTARETSKSSPSNS